MLYSPARDQLVKSLHLLKVDRPKKYRVLSFCSVEASNPCLCLITLNLICLYQFVAKSYDKTIISGGFFQSIGWYTCNYPRSTIFTLGSVNICSSRVLKSSYWPLKSQSNDYIIYYRVLITANLFIMCIWLTTVILTSFNFML